MAYSHPQTSRRLRVPDCQPYTPAAFTTSHEIFLVFMSARSRKDYVDEKFQWHHRTRDLPACSAVPQPTVPPSVKYLNIFSPLWRCLLALSRTHVRWEWEGTTALISCRPSPGGPTWHCRVVLHFPSVQNQAGQLMSEERGLEMREIVILTGEDITPTPSPFSQTL